MKNSFKLIALAFAAIVTFGFMYADVLPIGGELPMKDVVMKNAMGKDISLKNAAGETGLLVMFSCNTCPYVIKNQDRTIAAAQHALSLKIGTILINSNEGQRTSEDSYAAMKDYAKEQGYAFPYTIDEGSKIADAFGATRTPECFLFDKNMKLVYHGAIDDNPSNAGEVSRQHLAEAMMELKAGKDISVKESKSVGCTIKRAK